MPTISFDLDSNGKKLQGELDKSNRKVEKLEGQLAKMGHAGERAGKGMASAAGEAESGFASAGKQAMLFVGTLLGVNGVQAAIGKVVELANKAYANVRKLENQSFDQQVTAKQAEGTFLSNNPQFREDDKGAQRMFETARKAATSIGGENAYQRALGGLTELRSGTPGADEKMQREALLEAAKWAQLDPSTDIGDVAVGLVKHAQARKVSIQQASNALRAFGSQAGGNIADLVGSLGELTATSGLGKAPVGDIEGLFGFLTAALGDKSGEETKTTVANLLVRVNSKDLKINGKKIKFKSENAVDRLVEVTARIKSGEFGDETKAYYDLTGSMGKQSKSGILALKAIGDGQERLADTRRAIKDAEDLKESITDQLIAQSNRLNPGVQEVRKVEVGQQQADAALRRNMPAAARESAIQQIDQFQREYGIVLPTEDNESKIKKARDVVSRMKDQSADDFVREEKLRMFKARYETGDPMVEVTPLQRAMTMREAQLAALQTGAVDAKGGLSIGEGSILAAGGISDDEIAQLSKLGEDKRNQDQFAKELASAIHRAAAALRKAPEPDQPMVDWRRAVDAVTAFQTEVGGRPSVLQEYGILQSSEKAMRSGTVSPEEWQRQNMLPIFQEAIQKRVPAAAERNARLAQLDNMIPVGEEATGKDIMAATTPEGAAQAALRAGAVDFSDGVDQLERVILQAMGANTKQLDQLQQQWKDGMTEAFDRSLQKLVQELRANPPAPARPPSQEVE